MPDNLTEWVHAVSYVIGLVAGGVALHAMWTYSKDYWAMYGPEKDNNGREAD